MPHHQRKLLKYAEASSGGATPTAIDLFDVAALVPAGDTSAVGTLVAEIAGYICTADDDAGGYRPSTGWKWDSTTGLALVGSIAAGVTGEDDAALAATLQATGTKLQALVTGKAAQDTAWSVFASLYMHSSDEYTPPAAFSPLDLSPKVWLRSTDVTKSGTDISSWTDLSGNTHPVEQSDAAKKPDADTVSGVPTVRCDDANNGQMQQASATDDWSGGYTIVCVMRRYGVDSPYWWPLVALGYASNPTNFPVLYMNQWSFYTYHNGAGVNASVVYNPDTAGTIGGDPHWNDLLCITADSAGTDLRIRVNAGAFATASGAGAPAGAGKIGIGNLTGLSGYGDLRAHIYEILVFAPKLGTSDLADLYAYLEAYYTAFGA